MNFSVLGTIYYWLFLLFFILFIICNYIKVKWLKNVLIYTTVIILTLFAGLRWETGTDWDNYYQLFKEINFRNFNNDIFYHYDIGYKVLNCIVNSFTSSYTLFLIIITFISVYTVCWSLKKAGVDVILGLWIFYSNYFISTYLGSNRRIIAIGLAMMAVVCWFYNEKKKSIILEIVAVLFHWSSICVVIAGIVPKKIIEKWKFICIIVATFILGATRAARALVKLMLSIINWIGFKQLAATGQFYLSENMEDLGTTHFTMAVIKRIIVLLVIYFCYVKWTEKKSSKFEYFFNLYFISVCIYMFFNGMGVFQILSVYFAIMEIFMWGALYQELHTGKKKYLITFLFVLYTAETLASFPAYIDLYIPYRCVLMK